MISNEQRAHDLAIAMTPMMVERSARVSLPGANLNIFEEYLSLYALALDRFNREFPAHH